MKILNKVINLQNNKKSSDQWLPFISKNLKKKLAANQYPLRFSIVDISKENIKIEMTIVEFDLKGKYAKSLRKIELITAKKKSFQDKPFSVVQIIPTGIRCEIGGYAGDATPVTNLLASVVDTLITHPNAVNASDINEMSDNILYVEGKILDDFLLGHVALRRQIANKIGTFADPTGLKLIDNLIHALNSARAVAGIDCKEYTILNEELGINIEWSETGCAIGTIERPLAILEGVEKLLSRGVDCVGGLSVMHGGTKEIYYNHLHGKIPNPSGGIEAIITHLVSKIFRVPTAHAPLPYHHGLKTYDTINPRASAEFVSTPHYFCVLKGLHNAPKPININSLDETPANLITLNNVGAIIIPASALGGIPSLAAEFSRIPIIAVKENKTILKMTNDKMKLSNVISVASYLEAVGVVAALKKGISLESLRRPLYPSTKYKI